ncbi:MAG: tetratricopeptide repeat protein [Anaerolineae bacterium]
MRCPACGRIVNPKMLFCPQCGLKLAGLWTSQPAGKPGRSGSAPRPAHARAGCGRSIAVILIALLLLLVIAGLGVAGIYYGMRDRNQIESSAAADHFARGVTYQTQGEYELAIAEYEATLQLDPRYPDAAAKIDESRQALQVVPTNTPALQQETNAEYYREVQDAYQRGAWDEVLDLADRLIASDPNYRRAEVDDMLFDAFYQGGLQSVEEGRLQDAVREFDRALLLRPDDAQVLRERQQATLYLDAMAYWNADWGQTIQRLLWLYQINPAYLDVGQRIYDAYVGYGDQLVTNGDGCSAVVQYENAQAISFSNDLATRRDEAQFLCENPPTPEVTPGVTPEGTPTVMP